MIKVLFVDDEILAMEYLQQMICWEEHGFQVVAHARSGKKALEIYMKEKPEIVISDIKMMGMDGLELTSKLKEMNPDVVVVLLSAYKDFEYAQKGIQYGVSNYLLKHELCEEKLLDELERIRQELETNQRKKKIHQKYFVRQLIYNEAEPEGLGDNELGNRFFLILVQKNDDFQEGTFYEKGWNAEEKKRLSHVLEDTEPEISYIAEVNLSAGNLIVLYRIQNISSKYQVSSRIERMGRRIGSELSGIEGCRFNIIYSDEIRKDEISRTFRRMSLHIRYAVFWKQNCIYALERLTELGEEEKISWNERSVELRKQIYEGTEVPNGYLDYLFEMIKYPVLNLNCLREPAYMLESLVREFQEKEGIFIQKEEAVCAKEEEIRRYYIRIFQTICERLKDKEDRKYSRLVQDMIRYIRLNFQNELSLEGMGEEFSMNGVYLAQIFKKETGTTFLKYLTGYRIEEAKRLLDKGEMSISQVAEKCGYKNSQYFSQIFAKTVGVKPQEYRKWSIQK